MPDNLSLTELIFLFPSFSLPPLSVMTTPLLSLPIFYVHNYALFTGPMITPTLPPAIITLSPHFQHIYTFYLFPLLFTPIPFLRLITHILQAGQAFLAFQRYKLGASSSLFSQNYTDPNEDTAAHSDGMDYTGYTENMEAPGSMHTNYDGSSGYQSQEY